MIYNRDSKHTVHDTLLFELFNLQQQFTFSYITVNLYSTRRYLQCKVGFS